MFDDFQADAGRHHPVRTGLHGRTGIGVDHHRAIRVGIAECREFVRRAAEVQRARSVEVRHQDGLLGAQDLGGLAHEAHAGHDQRLGGMIAAEARHFQRIRHAAAGFLG
ncbi:hypothetical protein D3C87_1526380 [compost metagenome]